MTDPQIELDADIIIDELSNRLRTASLDAATWRSRCAVEERRNATNAALITELQETLEATTNRMAELEEEVAASRSGSVAHITPKTSSKRAPMPGKLSEEPVAEGS